MEEWEEVCGDSSEEQNNIEVPVLHGTDHSDYIPVTPGNSNQVDSLPWEPTRPQAVRQRVKNNHAKMAILPRTNMCLYGQ